MISLNSLDSLSLNRSSLFVLKNVEFYCVTMNREEWNKNLVSWQHSRINLLLWECKYCFLFDYCQMDMK